MGQALNLLADWAALDPERNKVLEENVKVLCRWLSDAQQRHAEISKCNQKTFLAVFNDEKCALPDDFLKIREDFITWDSVTRLGMVPYEVGVDQSITTPIIYSIFNGYLYVWGASDNTELTIPYFSRTTELTPSNVKNEDFELPQEFHKTFILYLDSMWARSKGDTQGWLAISKLFEVEATNDGIKHAEQRVGVQYTRGGWL